MSASTKKTSTSTKKETPAKAATPTLSASAFKSAKETAKSAIVDAVATWTKAGVQVGEAFLDARAVFVAAGQDPKAYMTWAENISGLSSSSIYNLEKAARVFRALPETSPARGWKSDQLAALDRVPENKRPAVIKRSGASPSVETVRLNVTKAVPKSTKAQKAATDREAKSVEALARKLRDVVVLATERTDDPFALIGIGAALAAKHGKLTAKAVGMIGNDPTNLAGEKAATK
jgi:hypothetical protein